MGKSSKSKQCNGLSEEQQRHLYKYLKRFVKELDYKLDKSLRPIASGKDGCRFLPDSRLARGGKILYRQK